MEPKPQLTEAEKLERLRLKRIAKITARSGQSFDSIISNTPKSTIGTPMTQMVSTPIIEVNTPILESPRRSEMVELPEIKQIPSPEPSKPIIETPIQPQEPKVEKTLPKIDFSVSEPEIPKPSRKSSENFLNFDFVRKIKFYVLILTAIMIFMNLSILEKFKPMQIFMTIEIAFGSVLFLEFVNKISVGFGIVEFLIYFMQCVNTFRSLMGDFAIFVITYGICTELKTLQNYF